MPDEEMLDHIAQLIAGCYFDAIPGPEQRARVIELAIMAEQNDAIHEIRDRADDVAQWFRASDYHYHVR